jgi:CelD/BcsL family acetyltransferase involved in cellulose biosynthesis
MLTLDRIHPDDAQWREIDARPGRLLFQTREWVSFVARTKDAEPVVAAVRDGSATVGYFTGLVIRRYGIRILGSPMPGWTTHYMGLDLDDGVSPGPAVAALLRFAFEQLGCLHLELRHPQLALDDVGDLGFEFTPKTAFVVDLRPSEDEIWARMTSACRRCIRKAEKVGVVIEEASDPAFAADYYAQLEDVFAKQSLVPTYGVERVEELIAALQGTGRLLLLRARDPSGTCVATGIFPAMNGTTYFWGGASWRAHQILRPNELLMWYALRYWKARGVESCDLGGGADYKRKYGIEERYIPFLRKSRFTVLSRMRDAARFVYRRRQRVLGRLARERG